MMPFATTPTADDAVYENVPEDMQIKELKETIKSLSEKNESLKEKNEYLDGQCNHVMKNLKKYMQLNGALEEENGALKEKHGALVPKYNALESKGKGNKRARHSDDDVDADEDEDEDEEMDDLAIEAKRKKQYEAFVAKNNEKLEAIITLIINDINHKTNHGMNVDGRILKIGWPELLKMWLYNNFELCKNASIDTSEMFFYRHYENRKRSKSPKKKGGRWVWKVLQSYRSFTGVGAPPVEVTMGLADCFE